MRQGSLVFSTCTPPSARRSIDDLAFLRIAFVDLRDIGELQQAEALGDAGTDLRRVAVDRLLAGEDDIELAQGLLDLADRLRERVGRRQRVGAGEETVGEQNRAIGADAERLAQRIRRHGRAHGQHRDLAAEFVAQLATPLRARTDHTD